MHWISRYTAGANLSMDLEAVEAFTDEPDLAIERLVEVIPSTFRTDWAMAVGPGEEGAAFMFGSSAAPRIVPDCDGWLKVESARALPEVAEMLSRLTRATDSLCRPQEHELAVLLPGTRGTGARRFLARVRDEASSALASAGPLTFSAGLVEWRPDETSDALAERVATAVKTVETLPGREDTREDDVASEVREVEANGAPQLSFAESLAAAVERARSASSALTVLVVDLEAPALDRVPASAAERVRDDLRARLAEIVAGSGTSGSLGPLRFAAVLDATATDAETAVAALRESLRSNRPALVENASVAAGVTELVASDDPGTVLARADRAVEQTKLGGDGTVVVATVNGAGGDA